MAQVWAKTKDGDWKAFPVASEGCVLTADPAQPVAPAAPEAAASTVTVRRAVEAAGDVWALFPGQAGQGGRVRVNGSAVVMSTGMQLLRDRDELVIRPARERNGGGAVPSAVLYFSTERRARIEPFPGADHPIVCPRCATEIEPGTPAVRCPGPRCGLWYHEAPARRRACWSYAEHCAHCPQQTELGDQWDWSPEEL